ncbi:MAG: S8 family serine peptidase, partial [Nocardioides sp.]|uniref:S8 family serine peptidase n=1 Tax=Nocardioides sp. TaxID=35761 RepID=UPI0039E71F28
TAAPASAAGGAGDTVVRDSGVRLPDRLSEDRAEEVTAAVSAHGRQAYLLKLDTMSTGSRFRKVRRSSGRSSARSAAKAQLVRVEAAQDRAVGDLPGHTTVLFRTHAALSGVAVMTNAAQAAKLADVAGVTAVYPITPKERDNSYAVPFQNVPAAWAGDGTSADGTYLGQGVVVADIDTGFDYTHADFGGPGTEAAYETAHETADSGEAPDPALYDADKFLAGSSEDLVGDDYDASTTADATPEADPDPLDCAATYGGDGHGSHTAGTIAGYGVDADGATYTGDYDEDTDFADMTIGPGMAPEAQIMALRVFGCEGSTDVISQAIDLAMDPNGDGDPSDGADVINLSLGSDFGSPDDADAVTADAAATAGLTVAISMGNSGDVYDVGGSPGASSQAITVASSVDAQSIVDGLGVAFDGTDQDPYAAERSTAYDWTGADLSGEVAVPTDNTTGCSSFDADDKAAIDGKIALLTWTDDALECGSATRGANVRAAGGIGYVFASNTEEFSTGITGDSRIPGVLVAASGGDAIRAAIEDGQTVTVTGTTASSVTQTITADNDSLSSFSSRGLRGDGDLKPDVTAVGSTVFSALPGSGDQGQTMSGTSMAAPMVAGLAALVLSKHSDWSPAQVKADIMNTADHSLYVDGSADTDSGSYAPMRVGAGRIDAGQALANDVTAAVADDAGAVSVSWGSLEVAGTATVTRTKTIALSNADTTAHTYDVSLDPATEVPGVTYRVSSDSVTVEPGENTATVTLTLSVDPTTWQKTYDETKGALASDVLDSDGDEYLPQGTIAESSGNVVFTATDSDSDAVPSLHVPYYAAPKPASTMSAASSLTLSSSGTGKLALSGSAVSTGGDDPVVSLVQAFELTATSGAQPGCDQTQTTLCLTTTADQGSDIADVGITSTYGQTSESWADNGAATEQFAIVTRGAHTTAADKNTFVIYLDTDGDGVPDLYTVNTHYGEDDVLVSATFDYATDDNVDVEVLNNYLGEVDTSSYDSDVLVIPVAISTLASYGVTASDPTISYGIAAYGVQGTLVDSVGLSSAGAPQLKANVYTPGIAAVDADGDAVGIDAPSGAGADTALRVTRHASSYATEGGQGLLALHFHNEVGQKAQVVTLKSATTVRLGAPARVRAGARTTLTAKVATVDGVAPTGTVTFRLGGTAIGTARVSSGRAALGVRWRIPRRARLVATYTGDGHYGSAASAASTLRVVGTGTAKVALSKRTVRKGGKVRVTVRVARVGGVRPTGKVTLALAGTRVGRKRLVGGTAIFTVRPRRLGRLTVRADYGGSSLFTSARASAKLRVTR